MTYLELIGRLKKKIMKASEEKLCWDKILYDALWDAKIELQRYLRGKKHPLVDTLDDAMQEMEAHCQDNSCCLGRSSYSTSNSNSTTKNTQFEDRPFFSKGGSGVILNSISIADCIRKGSVITPCPMERLKGIEGKERAY